MPGGAAIICLDTPTKCVKVGGVSRAGTDATKHSTSHAALVLSNSSMYSLIYYLIHFSIHVTEPVCLLPEGQLV